MAERKKVLLADDVNLFLELEKTFLKRADIDLLVARNGRQALEMVREHRPQLAFLDLYMPEMDGDTCCSLVKADPALRHIPIVMVTQGGRDAETARCRAAGCDELLFKPLDRTEFLAMADKYLGSTALDGTRYLAELSISPISWICRASTWVAR